MDTGKFQREFLKIKCVCFDSHSLILISSLFPIQTHLIKVSHTKLFKNIHCNWKHQLYRVSLLGHSLAERELGLSGHLPLNYFCLANAVFLRVGIYLGGFRESWWRLGLASSYSPSDSCHGSMLVFVGWLFDCVFYWDTNSRCEKKIFGIIYDLEILEKCRKYIF